MLDTIVLDNEITFNSLEKEIYNIACNMACNVLTQVLEDIDKKISKDRDKKEYRHKGNRKTTLKTLMGEVTFSRAVYENIDSEGNKRFVYLLDKELGLDTIGLISTNLAKKVVENACITSYRNTAKNISELTGQSISHGGAWNVIQALGKKIKEDEDKQIKNFESNYYIGKKEVPIIFEEADGVYINIQGKDRPKSGRKLEMKVAVAYEGWQEKGKNRYELVNKMAVAGFEEVSEFYKKKELMIGREYNVDEIKMRILNGDGATWIQHGIDDTVNYQLDPFHKYKAILRNVTDEEARKAITGLIKENKVEETLEYIDALANSIEDETKEKKLRTLYTYFNENKKGLMPYQERGLDIPSPPEGIIYRNLGTMEHHICDIIAQRMKHKKSSWSINGATNLAKLLTAKASKRLHHVIEQYSKIVLSEAKASEIIHILSAAKAPTKDGKGKDGNIHKGKIPFTECKITNGRKAILSMLSMRNFSNLILR
jgi:hypothetical protein